MKDKLLYYFYKNKKIPENQLNKSQLAKQLGYKSIGHFYRDYQTLIDQKLIEITEENNQKVIKITQKGENAFLLYLKFPRAASYLIIYTGIVFIFYAILDILKIPPNPIAEAIAGTALIIAGLTILKLLIPTIEQKLK